MFTNIVGIGPFLFFLGIAVIIGVSKYFSYRKQLLDRITLNPDEAKLISKIDTGNDALRFGLLFIGISLGFVIGAIFNKFNLFSSEIFSYLTGIFLCGGLGLIIGYFVEKDKKKEE